MDSRTSKQNYYLDIADSVLERSTCSTEVFLIPSVTAQRCASRSRALRICPVS